MIKDEIKAYFLDLDGTLLDESDSFGHAISKENMDAIEQARSDGKHIFISTGRLGKGADRFLNKVGGDYAVLGNGAIVIGPNGKILRHLKLSIRDNIIAIDILKRHNLCLKFDDSFEAFGVKGKIQKIITRKFGFTPHNGYTPELHKEYTKIVAWGTLSKLKIKRIVKEFHNLLPHLSIVTSAKGFTIEITHGDATKGKGNEFVASKLGLDKSETAHVGDSMNDATTIGHVGKLIVMKNAEKALKKMSIWRGPSYKKAGVAKVLKGKIKNMEKR